MTAYADKKENKKPTESSDEMVNKEEDVNTSEWTKEKKEAVFTSYALSNWGSIKGLTFAENGSYAESKVPNDFRKKYQSVIQTALLQSEVNGIYGQKEYTELMLCILYELKSYELESADKFGYNKFISAFPVIGNDYQGISAIYKKLVDSEKYYLSVDEGRICSIYTPDASLGVVLQGMFYGHKYLDKYEEYTPEEANQFEQEHSDSIYFCLAGSYDLFVRSATFAQDVLLQYKAVSAGEHRVIDN